jgi:5-methylcytosine-specific restriction protein A
MMKPCRQAGCPNLVAEGPYCERHRHDNDQKHDAVDRMYRLAPWVHFRKWFLSMNPACQRLVNGKPCNHPAIIVHHLISPRVAPQLFLVASNCAALCRKHHPNDDGTPWWVAGVDFVKTAIEVHI